MLISNVFEQSHTLRRIEEVMTDLLLCELMGTNRLFVGDLCRRLGILEAVRVNSVRRSVHDTSLGETDVEVVFGSGQDQIGLLIENKVRAVLMPDQLSRYRRRGDDGIKRGLWDRYFVAVFSPDAYRSYIPVEDTAAVDGFLSYEWTRDWLIAENSELNAFKIHMLNQAINDVRTGYVKRLDSRMTYFHQSVHAIASSEFPELRMGWVEQAGFDSSIIHLPHALPARGDSLVMKMKMGTAELRIETRDPVAAERAMHAIIPSEWRTTRAKGYIGVEAAVGVLDPTKEFDAVELHVRKYLTALRQLHAFYHRMEVSDIIEANRGVRPSRSKVAGNVPQGV